MNCKITNQSSEWKAPGANTDFSVTVSSTAVTYSDLSITIPSNATSVYLQCQAQPMRVTYDTSAPTATNGEQWTAGTRGEVSVSAFKQMKFIREGASDVTLWGQFFAY